MDITIVPDPVSLAVAAADLVESELTSSGQTLIGLAGGSTPRPTHDELARRSVDWSTAAAWIPDERWVSPDDDASNQRMARETLTERVGLRLLAPNTSGNDPEAAAMAYGDAIAPLLMDEATRSITMLGIGTDGHTASLFPGTVGVSDTSTSYIANYVPQLETWRITATFGLLGASDIVVFLVSGESKAEIVAEIAAGVDYPASRVTARERVLWILDSAAAHQL